MLESKQYARVGYFLHVDIPNPVNNLLKRYLMDLLYFIRPEDTTDSCGYSQKEIICPEEKRTRSTLKVVAWVAVSIALSLAIGQLGS